jgi:hypothetical protein
VERGERGGEKERERKRGGGGEKDREIERESLACYQNGPNFLIGRGFIAAIRHVVG